MNNSWLKKRRDELGLSQADLTRKLELIGYAITPGAISHWEKGRYKIPLDNDDARLAMAQALDLSVSALLELAGYGMIEEVGLSNAARTAAMIVDGLPPAAQSAAIEQLHALEKLFARTA